MEKIERFLLIVFISIQVWLPKISVAQAAAALPALSEFTVRYHPDGQLYAGDQISIEVISPPNANLNNTSVQVSVLLDEAKDLGSAGFGGISGGRFRAVLQWVWDTRDLSPGKYRLQFSIPQRSIRWDEVVQLQAMPPEIAAAHWETVQTQCCRVHYITGTDVEADLAQLLPMVDVQAQDVTEKMGVNLKDKLDVDLIPRILGQGGFASEEAYISYRHKNYANENAAILIHHELVHRVDAQTKTDFKPTFLLEGLAVYLTGGHYQPEPVMLRAAGLLDIGRYIPLPYLIDNFYPSQHETGYIEAGALIEYMVQTWGWDSYNAFYHDIHQPNGTSQSKAINQALQAHYGLTLEEMEGRFTSYLECLPEIPDIRHDVEVTLRLYDDIREYQKVLDPSAYFEQVWLPDAKKMREKGIIGDYLRGPEQPVNLQVEDLLYQAGRDLNSGKFDEANQILDQVEFILLRERTPALQMITVKHIQIKQSDCKDMKKAKCLIQKKEEAAP